MTDAYTVLDAVWRAESARIVAGVARVVRDVGRAEELAHDALVAALEQWPAQGVPENPGAWLASTARRRAIDLIRRERTFARKAEQVGHEEATRTAPDAAEVVADPTRAVGDDVLALLFATCHPLLARESRVALTLRLFGGLTTDEIARALPGVLDDRRAADLPGEEAALDGGCGLEIPLGEELAGPARGGPRGRLPGLQRGLRRDAGRRLGARRPLRRGDAPGTAAGRAAARAPGGPRAARADGAAGLAASGAGRARRRAGAARRPGPRRAGTTC